MELSDLGGAGVLFAYYLLVCGLLPTLFKVYTRTPAEWIRKFQHVGYSLSVFLLLKLFSAWYVAIGAAFLLVIVGYPLLLSLERSRHYQKLFVTRSGRGGELRKQLLYVQLTFALLILIFWGVLGADWRYIVAVAVMAWGFGDAAAALVGKAFGRRRILHVAIEGAKTYEGTAAMIVMAALALFLTLLFFAGYPWYLSLLIALLVAPVCGAVELFSQRGADTITVPLSTAVLVMPLIQLFSILGW
jgi:phytol kinase